MPNKGYTQTALHIKRKARSVEKIPFTCQYCGKIKYLLPCEANKRKYCSSSCYYSSDKSIETKRKMKENQPDHSGKNNPFYGHCQTQEIKDIISQSNSGKKHANYGKFNENSSAWKGDNVSTNRIHRRLEKIKGLAKNYKCIDCNKQAYDWSNINHQYSKNLDDYVPRCRACHQLYDAKVRHRNNSV